MLSKRSKSSGVDRTTWLHVCFRGISSPLAVKLTKELKYKKDTSTKLYTRFQVG